MHPYNRLSAGVRGFLTTMLIRQNPDLYLSELKALMEIFVGRRLSLTLIWNTLTRLGINHKQVGILGGFCSEFDVHPTTIH